MSATYSGSGLQSKATCTTGTEANALAAGDGMDLTAGGGAGIAKISVHVEANDGATNLTAGSLLAYTYNPQTAVWNRANDLDLTVVGGAISQGFPAYDIAPIGRLAYLPSGLGVATAVNVYINASRRL